MYDLDQLYEKFLSCTGVCTDTRKIEPGCLFVALKGPNFDANDFVEQALDQGARFAVVDRQQAQLDERCLLVPDGLQALQDLAKHHRQQLQIPVIGITGSNGKTTTKELIHAVLSCKYRTSATKGNLNNHIGVPLTLLDIGPEIEIAIVEMGANHVGEIAALCNIALPTHGLITNIGHAHVEGFGGFEGVIRGKSELYQYLIDSRGVVFINSQDPILQNMAKRFDQPYFYAAPGDYLQAELVSAQPYLQIKSEGGPEIATNLIGTYNFSNVAAALCIGKFFEVDPLEALQAVAAYVPKNNRSEILERATNTVILDAYNANPSSMKAALSNFREMNAEHKTVILGDMLELGEEAVAAHSAVGEMTKTDFNSVFLCGPLMKSAYEVNPKSNYFVNKEELMQFLKDHPINKSTILIKASRSMGLEELVEYL